MAAQEKVGYMIPKQTLTIKIASEDWEFEAVHRLNHRTFAEEIPQHAVNPEMRLIDKFHDQNTYAICLDGERLVGMICGRSQRPFSLDGKIKNLDDYLPPGRTPVEVRLLSVEKDYRNGFVFCGLVHLLSENFRQLGCDLAIISGTTRQLRLYRHIGFEPFGPLVGTREAQFQPMYVTLETFLNWSRTVKLNSKLTRTILANLIS
jgi:hypothetical protein